MNRRGFLTGMAGILAAGVAPAAVGSNILMPIRQIIKPPEFEIAIYEGFRFIEQHELPRPKGDTITYRRYLSYGDVGSRYQDVTVSLEEYLRHGKQ